MTYSDAGRRLTESFEQCRTLAYQDVAGVWTIGYGHTRGVTGGLTCIIAQADAWLAEDVATAAAAVNAGLRVEVSQPEFDALVDLAFNIGAGAFARSSLLRKLNAGDLDGAAAQFDLWDHAGGAVIAGLLRRRQAETAEFLSKGENA